MGRIVLITGGCRSGKSGYAQKLAEGMPGRHAYIATCPVIDEEMRRRIARHREARAGGQWRTIEEPVQLVWAIGEARDCEVALVDCLTLWVNNLMYEAQRRGGEIDEDGVAGESREVLGACRERAGTILLVTNEVGLGIVPENSVARRYRDLVGRCNQVMAEAADAATLVVCGLPLQLKGS